MNKHHQTLITTLAKFFYPEDFTSQNVEEFGETASQPLSEEGLVTMRHMVVGRCAKYFALKLLNLGDFELGVRSIEDEQSEFIRHCMAMQVHLDHKIANMDEHAQRTFYMTKVRPWYLADGRVFEYLTRCKKMEQEQIARKAIVLRADFEGSRPMFISLGEDWFSGVPTYNLVPSLEEASRFPSGSTMALDKERLAQLSEKLVYLKEKVGAKAITPIVVSQHI